MSRLVNTVRSLCAIGTIFAAGSVILAACGSPQAEQASTSATTAQEQARAAAPNVTEGVVYWRDERAGVCFGAINNESINAFGVECTPEVMALIYGNNPIPAEVK